MSARAPFSPALALYLGAARLAEGPARLLLARRAARGKEDPARLAERLGHASRPRPDGPLVWIHAASVGESLSALPLIEALGAARGDLRFLVTTGTRASAELMAVRLGPRALHQYAPLDARPAARRFVAHWRPDLCVWLESELWPALIVEAAASGAPLALAGGRMSARSAARWRRLAPGMARALLGRFAVVAAQDEDVAARLAALGAREVQATGSLKAGAQPPPDLPEARAALAALGRPLWLAASTHPGEEAMVGAAHRVAAARVPGLLTLMAPRHPARAQEIVDELRAQGLTVTRRALGEAPTGDVHLLDTLGEMGAWLRVAPVAFVGGSLAPVGGHNPHEPAALDVAILHGPHVGNFRAEYEALRVAGGAVRVDDAEALGREAAALLRDPDRRLALTRAARAALDGGARAVARTAALLAPLLPAPASSQAEEGGT